MRNNLKPINISSELWVDKSDLVYAVIYSVMDNKVYYICAYQNQLDKPYKMYLSINNFLQSYMILKSSLG